MTIKGRLTTAARRVGELQARQVAAERPPYIVVRWPDVAAPGVPVKAYVAPAEYPDWRGPDEWPAPSDSPKESDGIVPGLGDGRANRA